MTRYNVGDRFTVRPDLFPRGCHGVVYVVTSVPKGSRGVNYTGAPADGVGRGVRAPEYAMRPYVEGEQPEPEPSPLATLAAMPDVGALVTVKSDAPTRSVPKGPLYIVLGAARNHIDAVRLVRLGGDGGRYYTRVPVAWLTVIDPTTVRVA